MTCWVHRVIVVIALIDTFIFVTVMSTMQYYVFHWGDDNQEGEVAIYRGLRDVDLLPYAAVLVPQSPGGLLLATVVLRGDLL